MIKNRELREKFLSMSMFEGLTTDSYFGKTRPPGGRSDRKKGFLALF